MKRQRKLYLLAHANDPVVKIGISYAPELRAHVLPDEIDLSRSLQMEFESDRAEDAEKILQRVFKYENRPRTHRRDGFSEWFAIEIRERVLEFLATNRSLLGLQSIKSVARNDLKPALVITKRPEPGQGIVAKLLAENNVTIDLLVPLVGSLAAAYPDIFASVNERFIDVSISATLRMDDELRLRRSSVFVTRYGSFPLCNLVLRGSALSTIKLDIHALLEANADPVVQRQIAAGIFEAFKVVAGFCSAFRLTFGPLPEVH